MATDWYREESEGGDRQAERRRSTHRRILEAAIQVFAQKGYHDTAVDDIVRASNTSKGAVYFHFPNKQGIFLALVEYLAGHLIEGMESAIGTEKGAINKVEAALRTVLEAFASHRALARILMVEVVGLGHGFDPKLFAVRAGFTEAIKRHLDRAVAEGAIPPQPTDTAAMVWLGAINEVVTRWLYDDRAEPLQQTLPALRTLLLRSVGYESKPSAVSHQLSAGGTGTRGHGDAGMRGGQEHPLPLREGRGEGPTADPQHSIQHSTLNTQTGPRAPSPDPRAEG